jgi:hypothetical protein
LVVSLGGIVLNVEGAEVRLPARDADLRVPLLRRLAPRHTCKGERGLVTLTASLGLTRLVLVLLKARLYNKVGIQVSLVQGWHYANKNVDCI